jgi:hypothetical protein
MLFYHYRVDIACAGDRPATPIIRRLTINNKAPCPVSSAGDVNGDGLDDLIVGAVYADSNGNSSGKSYVALLLALPNTT